VSTNTERFTSVLRQIPGELYQLDDKPLLGFPPEFPWTTFSTGLANSLQLKNFSISQTNLQWRSATELFEGLGDRLKTLVLSVSPLEGHVWWVMPEQAVSRLMHLILSSESQVFSENIDESFFKAFYQFLAAEVINTFEKVEFDKKLAPSVLKEVSLPAEACIGIDISISIGNETLYGRLLLSQAFRKSWTKRYTQQQQSLALTSPIADALDVIVHLQAGKVHLKPSEWKRIVPGDFVILDSCSLDSDEDKGRVMLVINETPFFRAKIKQGSVKILEHPLYHEVETAMAPPTNKNNDESFDESDLDDTDFDLDEHSEDHSTEEHDHDDDDFDIDLDDDDLSDIAEETPAKPAAAPSPAEKPKTAPKLPLSPSTDSSASISIDDVPLTIVIEVGRIQMSVKKLLELQPGNMLDLNIHPEAGIDMVVNGKRIARGELLKVGDSLGIRILELS
jgi:flagellar motor switch protein FliN